MGEVSTIGVDIAKSVFQIHGVDADGVVVIRKRVGRAKVLEFFAELPPCLVGMEACATAHQWARELKKLGHDTRLMPPTYVKAYVKRGKNDAADAAAICEGVTRPSMRFVPIKSAEQQSALMLHRTRDLPIRQRTQLINALRAHLAELGLVAAKGHEGLQQLVMTVTESSDERLPGHARFACQAIVAQIARGADPDQRARHAHHSSPSRQHGQQTAQSHSRVRRDPVHGGRGNDDRSKGVQDRARVCSLDRIGAAAELQRWKRTSRLDFQAG
jgi:transposase